jgi:hypothetical protein
MNEQERADQLARQIDRLIAQGSAPETDPLLETANLLAGESLQPSARSVVRLERQLGQWFGASPAAYPLHRARVRLPLRIAAVVLIGIAMIALGGVLARNTATLVPSLTVIAGVPTLPPTATTGNSTPSLIVPTRTIPSPEPSRIAVTDVPTLLPSATAVTPTPITPPSVSTSTAPTGVQPATTCANKPDIPLQSMDDSGELPILLNISGQVQTISQTAIGINNLTILVPDSVPLPVGIRIGTTVTVRANLCNDDSIAAGAIVAGIPTATPVPPEDAGTEEAAQEATSADTIVAPTANGSAPPDLTARPDASPSPIPGCDKPGQPLAALIATGYGVPYAEVVGWHCKGFAFGVIARAYLLVITGEGDGKHVTAATILTLRQAGKRWSAIMLELDVQPDPQSLVIGINGNQIGPNVDCKSLKKRNKQLFDQHCKKPKPPKKPKK